MKDERLYLVHIVDALRAILDYTVEGRDAFMADAKTRDAVIRKFEVIGEATKRLSEPIRQEAPEVPWGLMARFRDFLIHQYDRVDAEETWRTVEREVEPLLRQIEALLPRRESPGDETALTQPKH